MSQRRDRLLGNAGGLLIAAGGIAAFTGGAYGLMNTQPGLIVFSVLLLMGYGVVGYLLTNQGGRYFPFVLPATGVLVLATLILFQTEMAGFIDEEVFRFVLEPALTLLLAYAAGALLTHVVEQTTPRVKWPSKGAASLNTVLHLAAYAPIWNAFALLFLLGRGASPALVLGIVGGSVLVAIACVVGGYAAARGNHPAFTVVGAGLGFFACVLYLFQFMLDGFQSRTFFGQFNSLIGLILTGLPMAIGAVAWIQTTAQPPRDEDVEEHAPDATQ